MKNIMMMLGLLISVPVLAENCRMEIVERTNCRWNVDYSTRITTTTITTNGNQVVVAEERSHPKYQTCHSWRNLGLKVGGYVEYESNDLIELFTEAGRLLETGECSKFEPQACGTLREKTGEVYVTVNNLPLVSVRKGKPADSLLEARKLVSLLSLRNLCQ